MKANNTCNVYANEETLRLENIGGGSFQMFNDESYAWHANGINPDRHTFAKGGEAIEYINNNL